MPRPVGHETTYLPGLDGIRAIAVAAVVAYHLGAPWMPGGLLGVGVFFTLSGFLITTILLSTWDRAGNLDLKHFWLRRARRLLPAVVLVLLVVLVATAIVDPAALATRASEALAALFYVANWTTIAAGVSYFDRFQGPGPLDHLWSLAVEEQFYLLWPLLLLGLLKLFRGKLGRVALVTLALAAVSFAVMWWLAVPGFDNTRAYEGTDTRAGGLLIGAAMAMLWRPAQLAKRVPASGRLIIDAVGVGSLLVIIGMFVFTSQYSMSLYHGGILLLSVATALLVGVAVHPAAVFGSALGAAPLRWIGERSYGIYLWHLPVIAFLPEQLLAEQPASRVALQIGLTLGFAALSWTLVEDPIRRYGLLGALSRRRRDADGRRAVPAAPVNWKSVPALLSGTLALILIATASLSAAAMLQPPGTAKTSGRDAPVSLENPPLPPPDPSGDEESESSTSAAPSLATSCRDVVHVGDSTSIGLMSKDYLPKKKDRIDAQYRKVGAQDAETDISGARSIVERWKDQPNAQDAVKAKLDKGYDGCWVLAMGTNEVANQSAGGNTPLSKRIDLLMEPIGDHPVLWLTIKTLRSSGPYSNKESEKWTQALGDACARYPNMRVYDWASEVKDSWYVDDGIHFTTKGYKERGKRTARALATAFPKGVAPPPGCLMVPS
jgi:peptidoglycan/LPS O-acetylase OafA/YrhL